MSGPPFPLAVSLCNGDEIGSYSKPNRLFPEHTLENRIHMIQVIAEIEQRLELCALKTFTTSLSPWSSLRNSASPRQARIALRWTIA